jgi:hypothetical protein
MKIDTQTQPNVLMNSTSRRHGLLGLTAKSAAVLAGVALAGRSVGVARADADHALVGSWLVAVAPTGAALAPPRVLVSFTGDGVALRTAPLQQAAPPALGSDKMFISTTHGVWVRLDNGTFGLTFIGFAFDDAGRFLATQRVRVSMELDGSLDVFTGPFKSDFVGADGQVVASSSGEVHGTRIQVELPG